MSKIDFTGYARDLCIVDFAEENALAYSCCEIVGIARLGAVHNPVSSCIWVPICCSKENCGGTKSVSVGKDTFNHSKIVRWDDNAGLTKQLAVPYDTYSSLASLMLTCSLEKQ